MASFEKEFELIKNSLEYYDRYQPKVLEIINKIEYVQFTNNKNITDKITFYDSNKKKIFESAFELLSIYVPNTNIWKWAWSLPTVRNNHRFISSEILKYALTLDGEKEYLLKSTLINSKIKILNETQLDIYIALSAQLSKKPFILKYYVTPFFGDKNSDNSDNSTNSDDTNSSDKKSELKNLVEFRKNNEDPNNKNYIAYYLFILDFH